MQISASPIHGRNQWPVQLPAFDDALRGYIQSMLGLGAALMEGEGPAAASTTDPVSFWKPTLYMAGQQCQRRCAAHALQMPCSTVQAQLTAVW